MAVSQVSQNLDAREQSANSSTCLLGYPDRFYATLKFQKAALPEAAPLSTETALLLYALEQQAVSGPCKGSSGWKWSAVENAKLTAWKQLGNMNGMEAMRLFVRTIEEEQADWYALLVASEAKGEAGEEKKEQGVEDSWTQVNMEGLKKPAPRYEHAGAPPVKGGSHTGEGQTQ
eukprot:gene32648-17665_t